MTATGPRRALLRLTERVSCRAAHHVLCVSRSLAEVAILERICPSGKIEVLGGYTSAVLLLGVAAYMGFESVARLLRPAQTGRSGIWQETTGAGVSVRIFPNLSNRAA
jgi:hypothetical protein